MITVDGPQRIRREECDELLRSLPDWFGIEAAIVEYVEKAPTLPSFTARNETDGMLVGFLSILHHSEAAAEIYLMGVSQVRHREGIGRRLVAAAESWLRDRGVEFLQVKTLGPSRLCPHYESTRRFYETVGFVPLEEMKTLWGEGNPCLVMIKHLAR